MTTRTLWVAVWIGTGCANAHTAPDTMRMPGEPPPAWHPDGDGGVAPDAGAMPAPPPTMPPPSDPPPAPSGPVPLPCGRTYDQQREHFTVTGDAPIVLLRHRDGTTLPESEGSVSCGRGCDEEITRLAHGATMAGRFAERVDGFEVQTAASSEEGTGRLVIEVCGRAVAPPYERYAPDTSTPGFNDLPAPLAAVPPDGSCTFTIRAEGGFVDLRAVTTTCLETGEPTPPSTPPPSGDPI